MTEVRLARLELRVNELEERLAALEAGPRPPVAREQMVLDAKDLAATGGDFLRSSMATLIGAAS